MNDPNERGIPPTVERTEKPAEPTPTSSAASRVAIGASVFYTPSGVKARDRPRPYCAATVVSVDDRAAKRVTLFVMARGGNFNVHNCEYAGDGIDAGDDRAAGKWTTRAPATDVPDDK